MNGIFVHAQRTCWIFALGFFCQAGISQKAFGEALSEAKATLTISPSEHSFFQTAEMSTDQLIQILQQSKQLQWAEHKEGADWLKALNSSLSNFQKKQILRKLKKAQKVHQRKAQDLNRAHEQELLKIKDERREIQRNRLSSDERGDSKASRLLFESLLAESNLKARMENELQTLAAQNSIRIRIATHRGQFRLVSLKTQKETLWEIQNPGSLAQNQRL